MIKVLIGWLGVFIAAQIISYAISKRGLLKNFLMWLNDEKPSIANSQDKKKLERLKHELQFLTDTNNNLSEQQHLKQQIRDLEYEIESKF